MLKSCNVHIILLCTYSSCYAVVQPAFSFVYRKKTRPTSLQAEYSVDDDIIIAERTQSSKITDIRSLPNIARTVATVG